ncbi:Lrp/AsnC family transcriptional regulator [Leptolyngbya sp. GB1-A1]|uniref:Lrp/AsnC family transcriptional regulator n=1 Tax=Leptolyngbya sp. GB1-A1 TaxID=2933908 RepID=UPI003298843E
MEKTNNGINLLDDQSYNVDQLDLDIIEYLQADGRISYSLIAREVEVPEATIRYRVKRLLDEGIIKISAFINAGKIKYANVAYIELDVDPVFFEDTLYSLIDMEKVSYVSSVTGEYNVMMEYVYSDNDDLLSFLNMTKAKPEVNRLHSRTIIKIHKAQYPARLES